MRPGADATDGDRETSRRARAIASNAGRGVAPGNTDGQVGYVVDLVLSSDSEVPDGLAPESAGFREDALLRNGRTSATRELVAGEELVQGFEAADLMELDPLEAQRGLGSTGLDARVIVEVAF